MVMQFWIVALENLTSLARSRGTIFSTASLYGSVTTSSRDTGKPNVHSTIVKSTLGFPVSRDDVVTDPYNDAVENIVPRLRAKLVKFSKATIQNCITIHGLHCYISAEMGQDVPMTKFTQYVFQMLDHQVAITYILHRILSPHLSTGWIMQ
jgi:hypothetical protein